MTDTCSCGQAHPADEFPEGRILTVRIQPLALPTTWAWVLYEGQEELGRSRVYRTEGAAVEAAREAFGCWLGSVVGIDLERPSGPWERLR